LQVLDWIQAEVEAAASWTYYSAEPLTMEAAPCCAVWWVGDSPRNEFSTMITTVSGTTQGGWQDVLDNYAVRYWEAVPDPARLMVDDAATARVEDTLDSVRAVIFNHSIDLRPFGSDNVRYGGARTFNQVSGESLVRGFQFSFTADKPIAYT
jgi:hypothetical protein